MPAVDIHAHGAVQVTYLAVANAAAAAVSGVTSTGLSSIATATVRARPDSGQADESVFLVCLKVVGLHGYVSYATGSSWQQQKSLFLNFWAVLV